MSDDKCQTQVSDGGRWPTYRACGRPIARNGLCKLHAGVKDRQEAKLQDLHAKRGRSRAAQVAAHEALDELGVEGYPNYDHTAGEYTGDVVVSVATLRKLASRQLLPEETTNA